MSSRDDLWAHEEVYRAITNMITIKPREHHPAPTSTPMFRGRHLGHMSRHELNDVAKELGLTRAYGLAKDDLVKVIGERLDEAHSTRARYGI